MARTSRKMFCPKFKYFQVQDGKSFAKVIEIITICSPAVLFKGLFVMFAKSFVYDSIATVGETGVWLRADFQSGSRVLKKVF